jgi:hypothetical protein
MRTNKSVICCGYQICEAALSICVEILMNCLRLGPFICVFSLKAHPLRNDIATQHSLDIYFQGAVLILNDR